MAFYDTTWYTNFGNGSSTGYYAVTVRPQNTAVAAGVLRRQFTAPAAGNERVFTCIVAGTTANTTDATWTITRGAKTTDGTATWIECTGASAVNGDLTNTPTWAQAKATATPSVGAIIQRNNGASYQICTTAGSMAASEPSFSNTAGVTTTDGTAVWTSLGAVGNFTGGQAPHARLGSALTTNWFVPGNTVYVGDNHAETQASAITNIIAGNANLINRVLCHNHSGSYPPASGDIMTGATISATSNFAITFTFNGSTYIYGIALKAGVGGSGGGGQYIIVQSGTLTANQNWVYLDNCSLQVVNTGSGGNIQIGNLSTTFTNMIWNNTTVYFGHTSGYIWPLGGKFCWQNTGQVLAASSAIPATLLGVAGTQAPVIDVVLEALDLSQLTGSLFGNTAFPNNGDLLIRDCKLNASTTVTTPSNTGMNVQLVRCDSGATGYKSARYTYEGTETTETSITRVGGAVDPTGQAQTRKIVTTANAQWLRPFQAESYAIWNTVTGSTVTVTVYGTINAGAVPNNDDLWMDVEYLSSSGSPLGTIVTTTKSSLLATNAAVSSDGSSWNGGGSGAGWSPFKLVATLSSPQPGLAGYLDVRVRAAKASTTYYIDPKIELT